MAALRGLFNLLVVKQVVPENPAMFVKGPKFSRQVDITPIMEAEQVRVLLDSIPVIRKGKLPKKHGGGHKEVADIKGLRDRAAIAIMAYTFARVSAVVGVRRGNYRMEGKHARLRLLEKATRKNWSGCTGRRKSSWTRTSKAGIDDPDAALFESLNKAHGSPAKPSPGATCWTWSKPNARQWG